jgi:hypothetical protein
MNAMHTSAVAHAAVSYYSNSSSCRSLHRERKRKLVHAGSSLEQKSAAHALYFGHTQLFSAGQQLQRSAVQSNDSFRSGTSRAN